MLGEIALLVRVMFLLRCVAARVGGHRAVSICNLLVVVSWMHVDGLHVMCYALQISDLDTQDDIISDTHLYRSYN